MRFSLSIVAVLALLPSVRAAERADVMRTTSELNAFHNRQCTKNRCFDMTGTVCRAEGGHLIAEDEHGCSWFYLYPSVTNAFRRGDRCRLVGIAVCDARTELQLTVTSAEDVGRTEPRPPVDVRIDDIDELRLSFTDIRTTGIAMDVLTDEIDDRYSLLLLKDRAARLPVSIETTALPDVEALVGARVSVVGTFFRGIRGTRKYTGPVVLSRRIQVLEPPPVNPFAATPRLESAWYLTPREVATLDRRRICGEVLACWGGNRLIVRNDDSRIVNVRLSRGTKQPAVGTFVDVVGYPLTDLFALGLSNARWQAAPSLPRISEQAGDITPEDILLQGKGRIRINSTYHGQLVRLRGIVRSLPDEGSVEKRILLDAGRFKVPVDVTSCPDAASGIQIGAEIEVTGRCLIETTDWSVHDIFPQATGFAIVARSAEDFRVLADPPWWTPARLLLTAVILFAGLAVIVLWNLSLQVLVKRRARQLFKADLARATSELRVKDRTHLSVELHDSLSQILTGVSMEVEAAIRHGTANPETQLRHLEIADKLLKSCRNELRNSLWDLRNEALEEHDLGKAIQRTLMPHVRDVTLKIRFRVPRARLTDNTTHEILRIIRELTVNGISHGGATSIAVAGSIQDRLLMFSVRDNGTGFDPDTAPGVLQGHFGLEGIRERLRSLKGRLSFESVPGRGTKATVVIPLPNETK